LGKGARNVLGKKDQWTTVPEMAAFLSVNDPAVALGFNVPLPTLIVQGTTDAFVPEQFTRHSQTGLSPLVILSRTESTQGGSPHGDSRRHARRAHLFWDDSPLREDTATSTRNFFSFILVQIPN
jgi:hypothetical protein